MKQKFKQGIVAVVLAGVMALQSTPIELLSALAEEIADSLTAEETIEREYYTGDMVDKYNIGESCILQENIENRTSTTKEFLMSDNTIMVQQFIEPVHYYDNGEYKDIDNSLEETIENGETIYKNKSNSFKVKFNESKNKTHSMKIEDAEYDLTLSYKGKKDKSDKVKIKNSNENKKEEYKGKEHTRPVNNKIATGQITYSAIENDTDMVYKIKNSTVSENIVINKTQTEYSYTFELFSSNLQFMQNEDGSISAINSSGKTKIVMPVPYMVDANGVYSNAVSYELSEDEKNIKLTLQADASWINNAKFPVTITPEIKKASSQSFDFVNLYEGGKTITSAEKAYIGKKNEKEKSDAFLNFSIPEVKPYYQLIGAAVSLEYETKGMSLLDDKNLSYNVYVAESTSDLSSVIYEEKPNAIQPLNGIARSSQHSEKTFTYESDIINTNNLSSNTMTIAIETAEETSENGYIALAINASETISTLYWYQRTIGIEDDYSMESVGIAGATGYLNNGTGQLTAVLDLVSVNTLSDMPLEVSLVYNDYYNEVLDGINKTPIVGNNFKLNFQQFIYLHDSVYELIDADGSISTFYLLSAGVYYSKEKKLYFNSSTGVVYDLLGNQMKFTNGRLTEISSQNNPTEYIKVVYASTSSDQITQVAYYANSTLKYTISFTYGNGRILSATTNVDTTTPMRVALAYDENGNLISIKNQTGINNTTSTDGIQTISLGYCEQYFASDPVGQLNYFFNNQKRGIIFDRSHDDTIYEIRNIDATDVYGQWRCSSSIEYLYFGCYTKIYYSENSIMTNMRYVSFNNTKKVISEWQQDANGIVSVQATTNWRNNENSTTNYTEESCSYYHKSLGSEDYGVNPNGGKLNLAINKNLLGVSDHENYRYAVIFKIVVSDSEDEIAAGLNLSVKIGNNATENIILDQGGRTYICIPCDYYENDTIVTITNNGTEYVVIDYFDYTLVDSTRETNIYNSSIKAHRISSTVTNWTSGIYTNTTYDDKQRVATVQTKFIETDATQETTTYSYYDETTATNIQKGKIKQTVTFDGNSNQTEKTEYAYTGSWNYYKETVTTTKDGLKMQTVSEIDRVNYDITQTDENNIQANAYYEITQGDVRLSEVTYANARETYTYNNFGQITDVNVYEGNGTTPIFSQTDYYDENGIYTGSSYGGTKYTYGYDDTGYVTSIGQGGVEENATVTPLLQYSYNYSGDYIGSNQLSQTTYANGNVENYTYSTSYIGSSTVNKTQVEHKNTASGATIGTYIYNYNTNGAMTSQSYKTNGYTQLTYDYGELDNLDKQTLTITGLEFYFQYTQNYDKLNNRTKSAQILSLIGCQTTNYNTIRYSYDAKGRLSGLAYDSYDVEYSYDEMGRLTGRTIPYDYYSYYEDKANEQYVYKTYTKNGTTYTTNLLSCIDDQTNENNDRTSTYDENGYVTGISYNGNTYTYTYDGAGRLTSEKKNGTTQASYTYDSANNIQKTGLTYTNGVLTSVNGSPIVYDAMGNPTTYKGNSFTWTQGRKLTSGSMNGKSFTYNYDGNGMRYEKTVNGTTTSYYYNGSQLLMESKNGERIYYIYGVTGIEGMIYDDYNNYYSFDKNTLGDIVAIRDKNGNIVAKYDYNAWGEVTVMDGNGYTNTLSSFIGNINPFRYRAYYYDTETGFYYVQTRYYDPTIGRFINADNYELVPMLAGTIGQLNIYAYCGNNPIMYTDETGEFGILAGLIIGAIIGGVIGGAVAYDVAKENGAEGWELVGWTALGVVGGGIIGGGIGAGAAAIAPQIGSFLGSSFNLFNMVSATGEVMAVSVSGAQLVGAGVLGAGIMYSKTSKQSGKQTASDKPSWVNGNMIDLNRSPQQNAMDILNGKYGAGNWSKGPGTEFNKIVKWIERWFKPYRG